ncbi:REP-associated tyrosine transposase [Loktanella sp. DJP18]|uniref:REP-associated tyrosine transposase n=1 Tax=Loktanella sp. DJP18 TaxID=3409788 RepID=UPI003BB619C3
MSHCSPQFLPGPGTFFFTVRLKDAGGDLLTRHIDLLRLSVRLCQFRHPFTIEDAVVLPDRLHTIWTLPRGDQDHAVRWQLIKTTFARHIPHAAAQGPGLALWQRRVWEQPIANAMDLLECRNLIRGAPVHAGLVTDPDDWPYSLASRAGRPDRDAHVMHLRVINGGR